MQINLLEVKNHLPSLIIAAEQGEEVLIARNGVPVAKIVRYEAPKLKPPGIWKGKLAYSADWNSPETNVEVERLFAGTNDALSA